jgi:hypothetical protein
VSDATMNDEGEVGRKVDNDQAEQLRAQAAGDTGAELGAFVKEVFHDHVKFPGDVVRDAADPDRRVDEEQGTATQPGSEPDRDVPQVEATR